MAIEKFVCTLLSTKYTEQYASTTYLKGWLIVNENSKIVRLIYSTYLLLKINVETLPNLNKIAATPPVVKKPMLEKIAMIL